MKKILIFKKINILALVVGFFLAVSIFYFKNDLFVFQANVLGINDRNILIQNHWDLGYKLIDNNFSVYFNNSKKYKEIFVIVDYDIDNINLDLTKINHQGDLVYTILGTGEIEFDLHLDSIDKNQSLFDLKFVGKNNNILIGEARGILDDKKIGFSIGNLIGKSVHN